jgi:hypothetical protein
MQRTLRFRLETINIDTTKTLKLLNIIPGQIIGFDNSDLEMPFQEPFLLAIPRLIRRGFYDNPKGLRLIYNSPRGESEKWTLHIKGATLGLWAPAINDQGKKIPHITRISEQGFTHGNAYVIESAYSGKQAILEALRNNKQGLDFYAPLLESGKLNIERGRFGKFIERLGCNWILPDQIRFK